MTDQYIITEEQWIITTIGDITDCTEKLKDGTLRINYHISSIHPYDPQAERERVLDNLEKWRKKLKREHYGISHDWLRDKIEALRQEGKVEK